jgi:hypothetical protein
MAVNARLSPTFTVVDAGLISTLDSTTAALTLSAADPVGPSIVARMDAEPPDLAVTTPLPFTVATAVLELLHDTVRPDSG